MQGWARGELLVICIVGKGGLRWREQFFLAHAEPSLTFQLHSKIVRGKEREAINGNTSVSQYLVLLAYCKVCSQDTPDHHPECQDVGCRQHFRKEHDVMASHHRLLQLFPEASCCVSTFDEVRTASFFSHAPSFLTRLIRIPFLAASQCEPRRSSPV